MEFVKLAPTNMQSQHHLIIGNEQKIKSISRTIFTIPRTKKKKKTNTQNRPLNTAQQAIISHSDIFCYNQKALDVDCEDE